MSKTSLDQKLEAVSRRLESIESHLDQIERVFNSWKKRESHDPVKVAAQSKQLSPRINQLKRFLPESFFNLRLPVTRFISRLLAGVLAFLTIATGWVGLRYDVSVTSYGSLDPTLPFQSRFLLTNDGPFSIYRVTYSCISAKVQVGGGREMVNITNVPAPVAELRPHGSYTIRCQHPLENAHVDPGAVLEIQVVYVPKFLKWLGRQGGQEFVLKYDKQGNAVWLPTPWFAEKIKDLENVRTNP